MRSNPLVSIGIPTYNRPHGLRNTLQCMCSQSYHNLEIIISDNASSDPHVETIVQEFLAIDTRIVYYRQVENIGAANNFRFVLEKAKGEYFMWAADDDTWNTECIAFYLSHIGDYSAYFSTYAIISGNQVFPAEDLQEFDGKISNINLEKFISNPCPSMIYALFDRKKLFSIYENMDFDWADCFLILKFLKKFGFKTEINFSPMYYAGINEFQYDIKPANGKYLNPWKYFLKVILLVSPIRFYVLKRLLKFTLKYWTNRRILTHKFNNKNV